VVKWVPHQDPTSQATKMDDVHNKNGEVGQGHSKTNSVFFNWGRFALNLILFSYSLGFLTVNNLFEEENL